MIDKNSKDYIDYSQMSEEEILAEAEAGWEKLSDSKATEESVERVNSYINKIIETKKNKKKATPRSKRQINHTLFWLIAVFILIIMSFFIILKII